LPTGCPRDEALALPTEQSAKVALRTQQILGSETGVVKTVDPLAGSYYVESLTDEIEEQVWKYLKRIDRMGGAMAAIEKGYFQEEIRNNSYRLKKEIDENKRVIVGVNKYQDAHDVEPALNKIDLEIEQRQVARLKEFKSGRDVIQVDRALSALQRAAEKDENLMPYIITCVKSYTTLGEISNTLGSVFGKYEAKVSF